MSRLWKSKKNKSPVDKCGFCHQVIAKDKTHSGVYYSVEHTAEEEGGKIHKVLCLRMAFGFELCSSGVSLPCLTSSNTPRERQRGTLRKAAKLLVTAVSPRLSSRASVASVLILPCYENMIVRAGSPARLDT